MFEKRLLASLVMTLAAGLPAWFVVPLAAQEAWEYSPYRVRVWLTFAPDGRLSESWHADLAWRLERDAEIAAFAPWEVSVRPPPVRLAADLAARLEQFTAEDIRGLEPVVVYPKKLPNGLSIKKVEDIGRAAVKLGICDPETTQLGRATMAAMQALADKAAATPPPAPEPTAPATPAPATAAPAAPAPPGTPPAAPAPPSAATPGAPADAGSMAALLVEEPFRVPQPAHVAAVPAELVAKVLAGELHAAVVYRRNVAEGDAKKLAQLPLKPPEGTHELWSVDKLIVIVVDFAEDGLRLRAREMDGNARLWGPTLARTVRQPASIPAEMSRLLLDVFSPVARIEQSEGRDVGMRVRAAGLVHGQADLGATLDPEAPDARVKSVVPGRAAAKAGLRAGDVLTSAGGMPVSGPAAVEEIVQAQSPGHVLKLAIRRDGQDQPLDVTLDGRSPLLIYPGDLLRPVIRKDDRFGEPGPFGVQAPPWTFIRVDKPGEWLLNGTVHSSMKLSFGGRASPRTRKLALRVQPHGTRTEVRIETNEKTPRALAGYEIFAKNPVTEEVQPLGQTDWRGRLSIAAGDTPLTVLYVKNGGRLIARLPVVPGLEPVAVSSLPDDTTRLLAEGHIQGLQNSIMDLVAQREVLANRIRKRISTGKIDDAQKLLDEFRQLPSQDIMLRRLDQRAFTTPDRFAQSSIDKMVGEARSLVFKFIDPSLVDKLGSELEQAKRNPKPATGG